MGGTLKPFNASLVQYDSQLIFAERVRKVCLAMVRTNFFQVLIGTT